MTSIVHVDEEWHGEFAVARVNGEVDVSNVDEVGSALRRLVTNSAVGLVIDLSRTTYLDSAGINLVFALGEQLRAHQQTLQLVVAEGTPIARMVAVTSLDQVFPTHAVLAAAVTGSRG
jgi:anti-sigma B factor antagonist